MLHVGEPLFCTLPIGHTVFGFFLLQNNIHIMVELRAFYGLEDHIFPHI